MSSHEIISYVIEYRRIVKEMQSLRRELLQLRRQLQPSLTRLTQEKKVCEQHILDYLTKNGEKGLKYQDVAIQLAATKRYQPQKEKSKKLTELLRTHNITNESIVNELTTLIHRQKVNDTASYSLKIKVSE
jgi:hypothetical protein